MARVILEHGIHTEGAGSLGALSPYLTAEGFEVIEPDYGWIAGLETKRLNPVIVGATLPFIQSGDIYVAHSNGCAIAYELMNRGAPIAGAVFINGALERAIVRPRGVRFIDCYWNPGDTITEVAQIGEELGVLDEDWGDMGHSGPVTTDPAIYSCNCGATPGMPVVDGHSDFFTAENLADWGPFLAKRLRSLVDAD
jgi:hypothetical protein